MSHEKNANVKIKIKWITISGCKAEALCSVLTLCWRPIGCQLPPNPHPPRWSSNPPQHPRGWVMDGRRAISPPPRAFSKREVCGVTPLPTLSSITMEKKNHNRILFLLQTGISEETFSIVSVVFNKLSQVCDDMWPYPSPFVSNQVGFSSSSFPNIFPYLHGRSWYTKEGREKRGEKESRI